MPISPDFKSRFSQTYHVDYFDCDPSAKIQMVNLCQMLQMTSSHHAIAGGISFWDLQKNDQAWVLAKFKLEIIKMPVWQQDITIETWISSLDGVRSVRNFAVYHNGELIVKASSLWVIINTKTRRPQSMLLPHEHFEKFPSTPQDKMEFMRFPTTVQHKELLVEDTVRYSDLDMINHVTNTRYLQWIYNAAMAHNIDVSKATTIDMSFQKELLFKEPYRIYFNKDNQGHFYIVDQNEATNFNCHIS